MSFTLSPATDLLAFLEESFSRSPRSPRRSPSFIPPSKKTSLEPNDVRTLRPGGWLNDNVMNRIAQDLRTPEVFFVDPLVSHSIVTKNVPGMATRVARQIGKTPLVSFVYNLNANHWILITFDRDKRTVQVFDSFCSTGSPSRRRAIAALSQWTAALDASKPSKFRLVENPAASKFERQKNGYDCGVYVATMMHMISTGLDDYRTAKDIARVRTQLRRSFRDGTPKDPFL